MPLSSMALSHGQLLILSKLSRRIYLKRPAEISRDRLARQRRCMHLIPSEMPFASVLREPRKTLPHSRRQPRLPASGKLEASSVMSTFLPFVNICSVSRYFPSCVFFRHFFLSHPRISTQSSRFVFNKGLKKKELT